jgi:hypothetical protein
VINAPKLEKCQRIFDAKFKKVHAVDAAQSWKSAVLLFGTVNPQPQGDEK